MCVVYAGQKEIVCFNMENDIKVFEYLNIGILC